MSNEPAERLRSWIGDSAQLWMLPTTEEAQALAAFDAALAAERKATVERVRAALHEKQTHNPMAAAPFNGILAILDAEAAR